MKVSIYSLKKILFQGEAELFNCRTLVGEITVLNNHEPLIEVITEGVIKVVDNGKQERFFPVKSGFLEVRYGNILNSIIEEQ
ncbi:MAG: F0F1 ATP synthase subunit epsilon [bacterium]|nr:F0F1 ATP synthase subunit epsilon [bacterium]